MPTVELLKWAEETVRGRSEGEDVFARWFDAQGEVSETHTFSSLWAEGGRLAYDLRVTWGLGKGDRAVLCFGFGLDFFAAFLGCLRAGVLAVPVYPPSPLTLSKSLEKLQAVVNACSPRVILMSADVNRLRLASKLNLLSSARRLWPDLPYKTISSSSVSHTSKGGAAGRNGSEAGVSSSWFRLGGGGEEAEKKCFDEEFLGEEDVAFLQFTSGSTSEPKGVMVTFANLMHNATYISGKAKESFKARGLPEGERIRGFSWLPQYHDLGLIMCTLTPFVSGWRMGYMSPLDFVRRPLLWLRLLSEERAIFGCVPDFSLRLCVRKWNEAKPETRASMGKSVDLSSILWIQNGAEPIRASSFREFGDTFAPLGLSPAYAGTAYGLAEHVVGVCKHESNIEGRALCELSDEDLEVVGNVHRLAEDSEIKIVDPETRLEVPCGEVGEIWVSSPSVSAGYWGKPELTQEAFGARIALENGEGNPENGRVFLRTGDLARVDSAGRISISGRMKDLIIVRGRNLYPQDVEFAVQEASDIVRPGCVAAFSTSELGGELEVVMEVRKSAEKDTGVLIEGMDIIRRAVIAEGCYPSRLVAIKEKTIPKTTSGKIQRRRSRELLHDGRLSVVKELTAPEGALETAPALVQTPPTTTSAGEAATYADVTPTSPLPTISPSTHSMGDAKRNLEITDNSSDGGSVSRTPSSDGVSDEGVMVGHPDELREEEDVEKEGPKTGKEVVVAESRAGEDQGVGREGRVVGREKGGLLERQKKERVRVLTELVVATAGEVLRGATITADQALFDAGFDSLTAEEFVGRLQERILTGGWVSGGMRAAEELISSTTVFDCPTARHIAEHIESVSGGSASGGTEKASPASTENREEAENRSLAVVGVACRFPGGCDSPEAFWDFLRSGADATSEVPSDRWKTSSDSKSSTEGGKERSEDQGARGGFLSDGEAWSFDNSFFGVPPAEARCMDPQQRLMLEVGYEALHRAGYSRETLRGSDTGIFVGACGTDWAAMLAEGNGPARGPYTSTGAASSMLANRLSFTLGTAGPSMTIDTACSSSLVALRQACLHLSAEGSSEGVAASNGRRPRAALVGGVNLLLSPGPFDLFSKTGMLAPDGRSKAFSADANGYGRGEGCGAVVLKRLEDARADGDRVLAIVKGSAVGHNGRSATLTAPNGTSQRATIAAALRDARVSAKEVSYVEAHGTGTALGDPVEFGALNAIYGAGRDAEHPLVIGAVKSNIGHLEGAAGMSGLIKTILVLAHGTAPPNLHASDVNPRINLSSLPAVLPSAGGVTHLQRLSNGVASDSQDDLHGHEQAEVCVEELSGSHDHDDSSGALLYAGVSSFGFGGTNAHVVLAGQAGAFGCGTEQGRDESIPGVAFLFTGQGSQYPEMGRGLYESCGVFRAVVDECDEAMSDVLPRRLLSVLYGGDEDAASLLKSTRYAQPALFAIECATAASLRSSGVTPSAVMGHSLGELAAACTAGVMTLRAGVRLVAERGRLMEETSPGSSAGDESDGPECMAAIRSTETEASAAIERHGAGRVSLAAVNGPGSVVISGPRNLVELVASAALSSSSDPTLTTPMGSPSASRSTVPIATDTRLAEPGRRESCEQGVDGSGTTGADRASCESDPHLAREVGQDGSDNIDEGSDVRVCSSGDDSSPGFSTRRMSWLSGDKDSPAPDKGMAVLDGSQSTGSVSPSSDSEEGGSGSDSGVTSEGPLSDGASSDGPLTPLLGVDGGVLPVRDGFRVDDAELNGHASHGCSSLTDGCVTGAPHVSPAPEGSNDQQSSSNGAHTVANVQSNGHVTRKSLSQNGNSDGKANGDHVRTRVRLEAPPSDATLPPSSSPNLPADRFRILQGVSRAFHSPAMAFAARGVEAAASKVVLKEPSIPLVSNVTGRAAEPGELTDPSYWARHVLSTVRFYDGLRALTSDSSSNGPAARCELPTGGRITTFVEVGPSSLLCGMGRRALRVPGGDGDKKSPLRWIAAMTPDERIAGKSGLGHVVGAVKGVHYRRRLFPLEVSPSPGTVSREPQAQRNYAIKNNAGTQSGSRPPLHLLETRWVCVEDFSQTTHSKSMPSGDATNSRGLGEDPKARHRETQKVEASALPDSVENVEPVWLLAGRDESSYAEFRDVISDVDGDNDGSGVGNCFAHLLTLGPRAVGGESAAIGRLKRMLRGGPGLAINHLVYVVGSNERGRARNGHAKEGGVAFQNAADELASFHAFVGALLWAGTASLHPLPEAVVITRGVHACVEEDQAEGWWVSWLPGLLRSIALEHPHLKIRHVDLSSCDTPERQLQRRSVSSVRHLVNLLSSDGGIESYGEPELCLRGEKLYAPRLEEGRAVAVQASGRRCSLAAQVSAKGTYVITGGTGGIGLELALRLAKAGAGGLVLLSRQGKDFVTGLEAASPRALAWKSLCAVTSTKVVVLRCDVTRADDVTNAFTAACSATTTGLPPVRGIFHAACPPQGTGDENSERNGGGRLLDIDQGFLEAKVRGALSLVDSVVRMKLSLDFLVFFSSASAVLGLAGEAGYAAANGCLDGLAWHLRRARGLKAVSVQYGPWVESGFAVDKPGAVEALGTVGHFGVTNDEGFSALGSLLGNIPSAVAESRSSPVAAVMPMHWQRYTSVFPGLPPLLISVAGKEALGGGDNRRSAPLTRDETADLVLEAARQVTGWDGELGESDNLQEQVGMDSLQAVEFRRILCTQLGRQSIPTTLAYDCPTAGRMADELLRTAPAPSPSALPPVCTSKSPRVTTPALGGTVEGVRKNGVCGGGGKGSVARSVGFQAEEAGAEWEEERNLDNSLYLLYRAVRAFVAYFYMACVVMLPAWLFFWGVRQAVPMGGPCLLIFVTLPSAWLAFGLCLCLLVAGSKWLLVGRVHPGQTFNTHSVQHLKWWTIQRLQSFSGLLFVDEIRRSRLIVWYYRLLGARLGRDVLLNTVRISDPDLVTVGDGSTINEHADLSGHQIIGNRVVFGSGVTVGAGTVLLPSAYMAPEAQVGDGRIVGALDTAMHPTRRNSTPLAPPTPLRGVIIQVLADLVSLYVVAITVAIAAYAGFVAFSFLLNMANIFPGERMSALGYGPLAESNLAFGCFAAVFLLNRLYLPVLLVFAGADVTLAHSFLRDTVLGDVGLPLVLLVAAVSAVIFHVTHMVLSVCFKWLLVQRFSQVDGVCSTTSWLGFRKQITDRLIMSAMMRSVLMFNGNLGNSLWLMALGGPVGRCVSVMLNKNIYTEAELLTLGDDMHVGFASSTYCSVYTAPTSFTLRKTFIGDRGLNGAGSVTLPGATLPHGAALGPNTRLSSTDSVREGALHLGSPAPMVAGHYKSPARELSRLERVLYVCAPLPLAAMSTAVTLSAAFWPLLALARAAEALGGADMACFLAPLVWLGLGLSLAVTGAVAKWIIIGKQHPSETKLWSLYHYRTLLVLYLQIHAHFLFVDILRRGRLFNCYARLLGASVGRDADVATMYFTDHDLVSIGDRAVVQEDCIPHPQFYFEGNMSFEPVSIGAGSNAGARSVLLGGATIKPGGSLETLGLAAKASGLRGGNGRAEENRGDTAGGKR